VVPSVPIADVTVLAESIKKQYTLKDAAVIDPDNAGMSVPVAIVTSTPEARP
jgi:hypothetical protein